MPEYRNDAVEVSGSIEPAYDVAGDAFDFTADADSLSLAIFDGVGHGVRAGLLASLALSAYRYARRRHEPLPDLAREVDTAIAEHTSPGEFVTAIFCQLQLSTGDLAVLVAGHPLPLVARSGETVVEELSAPTNLPLGLSTQSETKGFHLEPGDILALYTDGVVEAKSPTGDRWELAPLTAALLDMKDPELPLRMLQRNILDRLIRHVGDGLSDDATLLFSRLLPD